RPIVREDAWADTGEAFPRPLQDLLDLGLGHGRADLPVDKEAAAAVEDAALVGEGAGDVEVRDVHMPGFVRAQRLHEALALGRSLEGTPVKPARGLEDTVDAGGAATGDLLVEHQEGEASIALQGAQGLEGEQGLLLVLFEPVVAWDPGVRLVGLAVAVLPGVPRGGSP